MMHGQCLFNNMTLQIIIFHSATDKLMSELNYGSIKLNIVLLHLLQVMVLQLYMSLIHSLIHCKYYIKSQDWSDNGNDGPDAWTTTICPGSCSLPYLNDFNDPDAWTNCQTFYDNDADGNYWYYVNYTDIDGEGNVNSHQLILIIQMLNRLAVPRNVAFVMTNDDGLLITIMIDERCVFNETIYNR